MVGNSMSAIIVAVAVAVAGLVQYRNLLCGWALAQMEKCHGCHNGIVVRIMRAQVRNVIMR